jgi:hypothetical protein
MTDNKDIYEAEERAEHAKKEAAEAKEEEYKAKKDAE